MEAREAGFSRQEMKAAGYVEGLKAAGFSCQEVKGAGYTCKEAKEAGYGCHEAQHAGWSAREGWYGGYRCCGELTAVRRRPPLRCRAPSLPPPLPSRLTRVPAALAVAPLQPVLHPLTIAAGGREGRRHTLTTHTRQHGALYRHTTHTELHLLSLICGAPSPLPQIRKIT